MKLNLKEIVENLIDNFLEAGDLAIQLREKGLIKKIKSDNTPVSNGDLEVNKFISKKISEVTPNLPIISEETSENKDNLNLKDFWLVDPIDGTYDYINNLEEFTPEIQKIYDDLGVKENTRMKSSLKFCVVAAGEYDGYVAEPRAYEWDIAAGHAILEHAGGTVTDFEGNEILYGKKDLKNPSIILKNKNIL